MSEVVPGRWVVPGLRVGPSEWREITQADITTFSGLTRDQQWIHVDVDRARRESPYGTTIAHGNLTLSLIDGFRDELLGVEDDRIAVNYGYERVRFPRPVPSGARVRARVEIVSAEDAGQFVRVVQRFTIEVEHEPKPACVAENIVLVARSSAGLEVGQA